MKKLFQRLLIFIVAVPFIVFLILFLPQFNHLAFNILAILLTVLGASEFSIMLAQKKINILKVEAAILGVLPVLSATLTVCFGINALLVPAVFAAAVLWLLVTRIFSRGEALEGFISRLSAGFAVLIYPGFLMAWLVGMSRWENAGIIILTFICTVFASDAAAWATGMLFGKGNRGIVPVSPNKSVAGFIGGTAGSAIIGALAVMLWPDVFIIKWTLPGGAFAVGAFLGLLTGIAAMLGDLAESAIKRSSGADDSGHIIPGRGGVLDSIDSVAFAAPVFYLAGRLFFDFS